MAKEFFFVLFFTIKKKWMTEIYRAKQMKT